MSNFHLSIFIISSFLIIKVFLSSTILEKYGHISSMNGKIIFNSNGFSEGEKMYFKITAHKKCESQLYYEYYNNINDINLSSNSFPLYSTSSKAVETYTVLNTVKSSTLYYTIEKKFWEYNSKGDYLLLVVDCGDGQINFENTEKDESIKILVIVFAIIAIIVVICICCCKKMGRMRWRRYAHQRIYTNVNGTYPYPHGQIYPVQGNYFVPPQEMRMVYNNPNGVSYNINPNIQYYNVPNMNVPSTSANINPAPVPPVVNNLVTNSNVSYQSYNMIPQSSNESRNNDKSEKPRF